MKHHEPSRQRMKHIWQFFQIAMVSAIYIKNRLGQEVVITVLTMKIMVFIIFLVVAQPALTAHGVFLMKIPEQGPSVTPVQLGPAKPVMVHGM
jgi:hypothetical protein